MHPAISYDVAQARQADLRQRAQRDTAREAGLAATRDALERAPASLVA